MTPPCFRYADFRFDLPRRHYAADAEPPLTPLMPPPFSPLIDYAFHAITLLHYV